MVDYLHHNTWEACLEVEEAYQLLVEHQVRPSPEQLVDNLGTRHIHSQAGHPEVEGVVAKEQHQGLRSLLPGLHIHSPLHDSVQPRVQPTGFDNHHGEDLGIVAARVLHH